jgi:hypothetical protein
VTFFDFLVQFANIVRLHSPTDAQKTKHDVPLDAIEQQLRRATPYAIKDCSGKARVEPKRSLSDSELNTLRVVAKSSVDALVQAKKEKWQAEHSSASTTTTTTSTTKSATTSTASTTSSTTATSSSSSTSTSEVAAPAVAASPTKSKTADVSQKPSDNNNNVALPCNSGGAANSGSVRIEIAWNDGAKSK